MKSSFRSFSLLLSMSILLFFANNAGNFTNKDIISPVPDITTEPISPKISINNTVTSPVTKQIVLPTPLITITPMPTVENNELKILIIGDSLILHGFGPRLEQDLTALDHVKVLREGQYSTGLNRIDYFDWYKESAELLEKYKPGYLVVMFGSNDGQQILTKDGNYIKLYASGWENEYRGRVRDFMNLVSPKVSKIFWIGQPVPGNMDFNNKFTIFNRIYEEESKNYSNIFFLNTWDRFTVNGKFSQIVADDAGLMGPVKENDGVHLTAHGSKILSRFVVNKIKELK